MSFHCVLLRSPRWIPLLSLASLVACGGGGGGGSSAPTPAPVLDRGSYGWILKAEGRTDALRFGLSLVNAADPATEHVVEVASDRVTDAFQVNAGEVEPSARRVVDLRPHTLVYIVGGDVRRVPLAANGVAPRDQVQRSRSSSACRFVIDAVDHQQPERSRFMVSTAGPDGTCDTADDGRAEVRLQAGSPGITFEPVSAAATPVAVVRSPATLAPRAWVLRDRTAPWDPLEVPVVFRNASSAITRLVSATDLSVLVESAGGLAIVTFPDASTFAETPLAGPGAVGWQAIGHDAASFYVYRNLGGPGGTWQVLRGAGALPNPAVLAAGAGEIATAALGRDQLYLTVLAPDANRLLRIPKAVPGAVPRVLDQSPTTTLATVVTSGADVHQLWRVTGVGSGAPGYGLEFIDEADTRLFATSGGGWPLALAGGDTVRFDAHESRTRFVFADRYGSRLFGDAVLTSYDAAGRRSYALGGLPGNATFGPDPVFASVTPDRGDFMGGFAARSSGGSVQPVGAQVFTVDALREGSLQQTSRQQ